MPIDKDRKQSSIEVELVAGVNEVSVVNKLQRPQLLKMDNWRVSPGGDAIEKMDGEVESVAQSTLGSYAVTGYLSYRDSEGTWCEVVTTADAVWRKKTGYSWTKIYDWSAQNQPARIHHVQDKIIITAQSDSRMILDDGTDVQFGITAPSTIPTIAATYNEVLLDEDCADISDWTDNDQGSGASTQATFDSKSCMRLLNTGSASDIASRYRTVSGLGSKYAVEMSLYFNTIGKWDYGNHFYAGLSNGRSLLSFSIDEAGIVIHAVTDEYLTNYRVPWKMTQDEWHDFRFVYDGSDDSACLVSVYVDNIFYGDFDCTYPWSTNPERVDINVQGASEATDVYMDYIKIGDTTEPVGPMGVYRYAVTYARNSGNYPGESNPIKSLVGSASQTGSGLDDLTMSGTYTGVNDITLRVRIDGTGATDTIEVSYDGGKNYHMTDLPMTSKMYLQYGVELNWGATTGHTLNDYWDISCDALSILATNQKVSFTSIPTSSDAQVNQRKIYRTVAGGTDYFLLAIINDNVTTTFVDNIPDKALGLSMEEDNDVPPTGKMSVWWDDRFWIIDEDENILYYSKTGVPDAFNLSGDGARYISFRSGRSDDGCTGLIVFKSFLYVLKRDAIFIVRKKLTNAYGRYEVVSGLGCTAWATPIDVHGTMFFKSRRGWEAFDGVNVYGGLDRPFSWAMRETMKTFDAANCNDFACSGHNEDHGEIWLSIPYRTGGLSPVIVIYNYIHKCFYTKTLSNSRVTSILMNAHGPAGQSWLMLGTTDGYVGYAGSSDTQDFDTNIPSDAYTGWMKTEKKHTSLAHHIIEYQAATGKELTVEWFSDFQRSKVKDFKFSGKTPTSELEDWRKVNREEEPLDIHCKYFMQRLYNNDGSGPELKVLLSEIFYSQTFRKEKIKPN